MPADLTDRLRTDGIRTPFPVQRVTLPVALAGRDLCGRAPTGSGKTLAFAIPLAANAKKSKPRRPRALVLVPTRELAKQVAATVLPLAKARKRWVATFYGGTKITRDIERLNKGVDVAIATPGRLEDLVNRGVCDLTHVDLVVIDEADRMADMGFLPVVTKLLDMTRGDRQTLLFSATLDGDVDTLVARYQSDPVRCEVDVPGDEPDLRHIFWEAERPSRVEMTLTILDHLRVPTIVFTRTKHGADRLAKQLGRAGLSTAAIHGDRSQNQRERALSQFARGRVRTLVATDVAARGIHVDDVGLVLHYDLPSTDKDYVHRSGRTGRAGATGVVVSLFDRAQHRDLDAIQRGAGLPRGMHAFDLEHLTAPSDPEPAITIAPQRRASDRTGSRRGRDRRGGRRSGYGSNSRGGARGRHGGSGNASGASTASGHTSGKGGARRSSR